jgi:hypothetical protein
MVLPHELGGKIIISDYQKLPLLAASLHIIGCAENMNSGLLMSLLIFIYREWAKITCAAALTGWRLQCMS